jgi:broad specificity phosphatase PhoE
MNALNKHRTIFNGQAETPLTKLGIEQAVSAGKNIAEIQDLIPTFAVSSTIQRSLLTARKALEQLPYAVPLVRSDAFRERSLGEFEGRFADEVFAAHPHYRDDPEFKHFRAHFTQKAPGGENLAEVTLRAWTALTDFADRSTGDFIVFSHATTMRCLIGKALALSPMEIAKLEIPNATPIVLHKEEDKYELLQGLNFELRNRSEGAA